MVAQEHRYDPGNAMIRAAFNYEGATQLQRIDTFHKSREQIGSLLLDNWEESLEATNTLHTITRAACIPSLAAIIESRPHSIEIAQAVSQNFRDVSAHIASIDALSFKGLSQRTDAPYIRGELSEFAIIGVVWWGIANGKYSPNSYITPASRIQDHSVKDDGYKVAYDAILRQSGKKERLPIQIKASHNEQTDRKTAFYRPDIAVMTPSDITFASGRGPLSLINLLARNKKPFLAEANERAAAIFDAARARGKAYKAQLRAES